MRVGGKRTKMVPFAIRVVAGECLDEHNRALLAVISSR
jgi:hypothetical protein